MTLGNALGRWSLSAALGTAVVAVLAAQVPQQATATAGTSVREDATPAGTTRPASAPGLSIRITSPLGRTGVSGSVRIVARVTADSSLVLSPVQFFVDGKEVGEGKSGPPYAVEWMDDDPFTPCEIVAQVSDNRGGVARDVVELKALEITESSSVASVVLEPVVVDGAGQPVGGLKMNDFHVLEDGVPQTLEMAQPEVAPTTYTLLIDSSQSMSRRMDFVREAAGQLPQYLHDEDDVVVVPFTRTLGTVTGPTKDRETIAGAVQGIDAKGGTSILDCLKTLGGRLAGQTSRQVVVLITDGYDEDSTTSYDSSLQALKTSGATLYVVAIGGVAGISLKGEDLLRKLASETGGRAFFPYREEQLGDIHKLIAADVQNRYMLSYTPTNQKTDGTWRAITVATNTASYKIRVRDGYRAPSPPPIKPEIELTLRDTNREFVDVGSDELQLFEDGVEQKIEGFEEALSPVSIILALDESGSMRKSATGVVDAARAFIAAVPEKDSLGLMVFADTPNLVQDLSKNHQHASEAVDSYVALGGTALYDALIDSMARLGHVDGRRAIVLLTDGVDENDPGTAPGSTHTLADVLTAAKNTGTTVFAIGLGTKVAHDVLDQLGQVSGGESFFPEDVSLLDANYHRVLENLRRRYVISYTSTNPTRDGAWRKVVIKCRRPGIVAESQGGFFAPSGG